MTVSILLIPLRCQMFGRPDEVIGYNEAFPNVCEWRGRGRVALHDGADERLKRAMPHGSLSQAAWWEREQALVLHHVLADCWTMPNLVNVAVAIVFIPVAVSLAVLFAVGEVELDITTSHPMAYVDARCACAARPWSWQAQAKAHTSRRTPVRKPHVWLASQPRVQGGGVDGAGSHGHDHHRRAHLQRPVGLGAAAGLLHVAHVAHVVLAAAHQRRHQPRAHRHVRVRRHVRLPLHAGRLLHR